MRFFTLTLVILSLTGFFIFGSKNFYFHHDDFVYFSQALESVPQMLSHKSAEHLNYVLRLTMKAQLDLFGLNYKYFLLVSLLLHSAILYLLYLIVNKMTKDKNIAYLAVMAYTINTNWNEVILWISGQVFMINLILIAISYIVIMRPNRSLIDYILYILLSVTSIMTSGLGVWVPMAVLAAVGVDYKRKKLNTTGLVSILIIIITIVLYRYLSNYRGQVGTNIDLAYLVTFVQFLIYSVANTVIGRFFIPFDEVRILRIIPAIASAYLLWTTRLKVMELLKDGWFRLISFSMVIYYLIIAVGRIQYGLGISRAERYSHFGLFFLLILVSKLISQYRINTSKLLPPVILIVILQVFGFIHRGNIYSQRPSENREMINEMRLLDTSYCYRDRYLPDHVVEADILMFSDIAGLVDDKLVFDNDEKCIEF